MSAATVVEVTAASHAYSNRRVLDRLELSLKAGEIYCLLGANGAGKTTLMRAICGRLSLDKGRVEICGRDTRRDRHARDSIGYVPQDIALYSHLTVAENLRVFGRLAGVPRKDLRDRIADTMARANLAERAGQITATLSGGYQRRVNICASILHLPAALVLDEPTVGIDVDAREAVHSILTGLSGGGTAILMTTHDLGQAAEIADRVGILHEGRIVLEGKPEELIRSAFGDEKEIAVTLAKRPDAEGIAALNAMGFACSQSALEWTARVAQDVLAAGWLGKSLSDAGAVVKEVRIREPDLASLFLRVVGKEGGAA